MDLKRTKLLLLAACLSLLSWQPCRAQEDTDRKWVNDNFQDVLNELLPLGEPALGYRSYEDERTQLVEFSLIFEYGKNGRLNVIVRQADSISLHDQMAALHRNNPSESIESIKKKLKVKAWHLDDSSCPPLKAAYESYFRLNLQMQSAKRRAELAKGTITLTLDPTIHSFRSVVSGGFMYLEITDSRHPFAFWARKTRAAIEKCALMKTKAN